MFDAVPLTSSETEPLVRLTDLDEYRQGLSRRLAGEWDEERWTAYRVRFGIYGQKQPGVQMVRIKVPGGVVPVSWLRVIAEANRRFAQGDAHITTRQDIQIYHVPLNRTGDLLDYLYSRGVTTREACGNTVRNITACALAGACPRERVDAGQVASHLARAWLRHPLVQHMPRKVKISVSGCATDCGASSIHDLAFVAVERDGRPGFRVMAGGGLGALPRPALELLPFAQEQELPWIMEALIRLHQKYSDRRNRNASRIKFLVKRFGEEKFIALFGEEFERLRGLPQRPWDALHWRQPTEAEIGRAPVGVIAGADGRVGVVAAIPLGIVSSDQLDAVAAIADRIGVSQLRTTRDQNLAFLDVPADQIEALTQAVRAIGFDVPESDADIPTIISCPGTTTCRIGITSSQTFAREALAAAASDPSAKGVSIHVSGCQNSCGLHHVADFGLHGMAKKIDGRQAPHYQLHFGGDARTGTIGLTGPIIPARLADEALVLLRQAYGRDRRPGEGVRGWAERLGKDGISDVLSPLGEREHESLFLDWGDSDDFAGAPQTKGECAAPFAMDDLYASLADDALIGIDRALSAGRPDLACDDGVAAIGFALRRLLHSRGGSVAIDADPASVLAEVRAAWPEGGEVVAIAAAAVSAVAGPIDDLGREAVALLIDTARAVADAPPVPDGNTAVGDLSAILGGGFE